MSMNMEKIKQRKEELARNSGGGDYTFWSPKDGKNTIRVMPPAKGKEVFWAEGYVHYGIGDENKMVTCLKTFDKDCPVCEESGVLKNSSNAEDKKLGKDIAQKQRIYMNIIDRNDTEKEERIQVMGSGVMIFKQILNMICDPDWGDITDLEEGRDINITKTGKGLNTEYSVLGKPKQTPASEEMDSEEIMEKLQDLDELFKEMTYGELKALLTGEIADGDAPESEADLEEMEEGSYDEMDLEDLMDLCDDRDLKLPKKPSKIKLIALLEADDEMEDEDVEEDEDEEEDELKDEIEDVIKKRQSRKKKK